MTAPADIARLKITLEDVNPIVMRRVEVPLGIRDPPPLKWSALKYGNIPEEDHNAEEETQTRRDRCQVAAG
jgi:hypothetical protein